MQAAEGFEAIHAGKPDVEKNDFKIAASGAFERFFGGLGAFDLIALVGKNRREGFANAGFVVNDEDVRMNGHEDTRYRIRRECGKGETHEREIVWYNRGGTPLPRNFISIESKEDGSRVPPPEFWYVELWRRGKGRVLFFRKRADCGELAVLAWQKVHSWARGKEEKKLTQGAEAE